MKLEFDNYSGLMSRLVTYPLSHESLEERCLSSKLHVVRIDFSKIIYSSFVKHEYTYVYHMKTK